MSVEEVEKDEAAAKLKKYVGLYRLKKEHYPGLEQRSVSFALGCRATEKFIADFVEGDGFPGELETRQDMLKRRMEALGRMNKFKEEWWAGLVSDVLEAQELVIQLAPQDDAARRLMDTSDVYEKMRVIDSFVEPVKVEACKVENLADRSFQKGGRAQTQKIFVRGFHPSQEEDDIKNSLSDHFSSCGEVLSIKLPKCYNTGAFKGFAFVEFTDTDAVDKALKLNGSKLGGDYLTVQEAKPRVDEGGSGGGRVFRSGGGGRGFSGGRGGDSGCFGGRRGGGRSGAHMGR